MVRNLGSLDLMISLFAYVKIIESHFKQLAKHVISIHMNATNQQIDQEGSDLLEGSELPLKFFKKFIAYARANCAPRVSEKASQMLINNYVNLRNPPREQQVYTKSYFNIIMV